MINVKMRINGKTKSVKGYPMARLLDVIREHLKLTGTKEGCGEGECGACSIMMNGRLVNSCLVPLMQAEGAEITTVEGIVKGKKLHRVQEEFVKNGGAQCGICTPGMIMASYALLKKTAKPKDSEIREALAGNLCRCTGYMKIFDSVKAATKGARR